MIDRKDYLLMARECAMLEKDAKGRPYYIPNRLKIVWQGHEFYPTKLTISFDKEGKVENYAHFHDLKADSTAGAMLWELEKKEQGEQDGAGT